MQPLVKQLGGLNSPLPVSEHYLEGVTDECFAELAWPEIKPPICILAGDQASFETHWRDAGWLTVKVDDIHAKGMNWLLSLLCSVHGDA